MSVLPSGSFTDNREEFEIPGDDEIYDSGSDWTSTDVDVTIHEIDLAVLAELAGCDIDEAKRILKKVRLTFRKWSALFIVLYAETAAIAATVITTAS